MDWLGDRKPFFNGIWCRENVTQKDCLINLYPANHYLMEIREKLNKNKNMIMLI